MTTISGIDELDRLAAAPGLLAGRQAPALALLLSDDEVALAAAGAPGLRPAIVEDGGAGDDTMIGSVDDDTLRGLGGDDQLFGGPGNDRLSGGAGNDQLFGDPGSDTLFGGADDDVLRGGDENDELFGDEGRDRLFGEAGVDRLVGGAGGDIYFVDSAEEVVDEDPGGGRDQVRSIVTFTLPDNVEVLSLLGAAAINGTGNEQANTLNGNDARNVLRGLGGSDTLNGAAGNDLLDGGNAADTMRGGPGNDTYVVDNESDAVVEEPGAGSDLVRSSIDFTLPANVENLTVSGATNGTGNDGRNTIRGSELANTIRGEDGDDRLEGGAGNDILRGGRNFDDLFGGEGDDRLEGGASIDVLNGGPGIDTFIGGPGDDFLSYEGARGRVVVDLARGTAQADGGSESISGIENVLGGERNDRLIGDGNANTLEGRGGNDVLIGGLGFGGGGPVEGTPVTGNGTLVGGLGGPGGFGENALVPQDDSPSATVDLSTVFEDGLDFFGLNPFTSVFINNNGNITFNAAQSTFTPPVLTGDTGNPIIAPFFADVDTRPPEDGGPPGGTVSWDLDTARDIFTVTWNDVGYFAQHTDRTNDFQLQLYDRGSGDFDMVFRYGAIDWTTGDASGGTDGLGGTVARAGWNSGNGADFFELPAAGRQAQILNLEAANGNTGVRGLWVFQVRNGEVAGDPDTLDGGAGNDRLVGGAGEDRLTGGPGNDRFEYASLSDRGDIINDFRLGEDVIDLSSVVTGFAPGDSNPAEFLQLAATSRLRDDDVEQPGFNLSVDVDGGGNNFVQFAEVFGAGSGVTVDQLVSSGGVDLTS